MQTYTIQIAMFVNPEQLPESVDDVEWFDYLDFDNMKDAETASHNLSKMFHDATNTTHVSLVDKVILTVAFKDESLHMYRLVHEEYLH